MFFREWFIVFAVSCLIGVVFLSQSFSSRRSFLKPCESLHFPKVEVLVSGAVQKPGVYKVEMGSTLQSVLEKAEPVKNADKSGLYLQKKVIGSCSLIVPEKKCRKRKKKNPGSSSMFPMSYTD